MINRHKNRHFLFKTRVCSLSSVENHRHICWFLQRNGQSKVFKLESTHCSKAVLNRYRMLTTRLINTRLVDIVKDSLCIFMCYIRALWDRDELRCQLFSDNKGASAVCSHSVMPNHARNSLRLLFCYSVLWMLMLSLNNKYLMGAFMLGCCETYEMLQNHFM